MIVKLFISYELVVSDGKRNSATREGNVRVLIVASEIAIGISERSSSRTG